MAALEVADPTLFVTVTVKLLLLSVEAVAGVVYVAFVAPAIVEPFLNHWKVKGAVPAAVTENVADCPCVTAVLTGCTMMDGAVGAGVTLGIG